MASQTIRPTSGRPGPVASTSSADYALYNEFNFIIPDYLDDLFNRYGSENYGMLMEYLGRSIAIEGSSDTKTFQHFEKGRLLASGTVNADVAAATGATITITLGSGSYYNSGAEDSFREGENGYVGSTGVKFKVGTINRTTPNAHTVQLVPVSSTDALASAGYTDIKAGEVLLLTGNQTAGEASTAMDASNPYVYRISNTTTEVRDDYPITDIAKMEKTQIDFGGGNYYYYKLAQTELNKRFMYYIENACMEGVDADNLTNGSFGTTGVIEAAAGTAPEVDYTVGNVLLSDIQALSRVCDFNGGPNEYHILQDTYLVDDINNVLFGKYNNGGIRYASVGGSEDLGVKYGFESFNIKQRTFHFFNYKNFSAETLYGATPGVLGYFRSNYGFAIPQGVKVDARSGEKYPPMQWVYQYVTPGVKFHTYTSGGMSPVNKTTTMNFVLTQICYVGARTVAPEQFAEFKGTY